MDIKCIIDTNILIQLEEPDHDGRFKKGFAELSSICRKYGVKVFYHPYSKGEIQNDPEEDRRNKTLELLRKYPELEHVPLAEKEELEELFGRGSKSNDYVDFQIMYSLKRNCADFLISQDDKLRSRSNKAGLGKRTFSIVEFTNFLKTTYEPEKVFIPNVDETRTVTLDRQDSIFKTIQGSYGGEDAFNGWLDKCDKEERVTWVINDEERIGALAIVKAEDPAEEGIPELAESTLKICTFKVSDGSRGSKLGELLLKQIFAYCTVNKFPSVYVTFFSKHDYLSIFLQDFGFKISSKMTKDNQLIFYKHMRPQPDEPKIDPLDFHIQYSPWHYSDETINKYYIPIVPEFHETLFPELYPNQQMKLPIEGKFSISGNSLKKVYVSNSPSNPIDKGSLVIFYSSRTNMALTTVGVVEDSIKTDDISECLQMVGKRSVYTLKDLEAMVKKKAHIFDFRLAYHFNNYVSFNKLKELDVLSQAPLSVNKITEEKFQIIQGLLDPFYGINN